MIHATRRNCPSIMSIYPLKYVGFTDIFSSKIVAIVEVYIVVFAQRTATLHGVLLVHLHVVGALTDDVAVFVLVSESSPFAGILQTLHVLGS